MADNNIGIETSACLGEERRDEDNNNSVPGTSESDNQQNSDSSDATESSLIEKQTVLSSEEIVSHSEKSINSDDADSSNPSSSQKNFEHAMANLNEYSDVDNYVELELDSSSSSNSSVSVGEIADRNTALYIHNNLLLNAEFLTDLDIDPFDVELMLENHGGHLLNLINLASSSDPRPAPPPYPCTEISVTDCGICFDEKSLRKRICCQLPVCDDCIESYLVTQINVGNVQLRCPSTDCNIYIHRDEILARLPAETKEKYYRFLVDANNDPSIKTCPRCSYIHKLETLGIPVTKGKKKLKKTKQDSAICVVCPDCQLSWCFSCQAPWHEAATCKEFRKGDKLLKSWAHEFRYGQNNAQKCPHCKVYIEKKGGCDHMTCIHCGSSFCYRCGERYMRLKFLGNHTSRLSPFGCRYNFMPDRPGARKAIRGSVLGAKLLGGVLLGGLIVAAGALFVGTSFIILPAYGGYRYYKFRQRKKWIKRHRKLWPELQKRPQILTREISTSTAERGEKLPPLGMIKEELLNSSRESTTSEDSNSISEEDIVAIGIQGEGAQKVEVLVHAQDQQGHSDEGQGKGQENVKPDVKDQIQVNSESMGKVHVTTIEVKKDETGDDHSSVVVHVKTTSKGDPKNGINQSEQSSLKESNLLGETTLDIDNDETKARTSASDCNECGTMVQESDKKEKHKNESKFKIDESEDSGFVIEEGNSETKGCFVRIFGKKLPVVWEKDKDGEKITEKETKHQKDGGLSTLEKVSGDGSLKRKKSLSSKSIKNQPDIVNCALIAEHKQKIMSLGRDLTADDDTLLHGGTHGESCDKEELKDPYYGIISADTCETPL